ncbi:hypothetical protein B0H19DRAFT_1276241 [Mycena capillaripes]|nr:hypothetical protein B0H19DRAFT_1276241 [Mycena capillaripes]
MSFFSNSAGILIQGGTFYSAAGDINVQENQHLTTAPIFQGSTPDRALGYPVDNSHPSLLLPAERSLPGLVRSNSNRSEAGRFLPYDMTSSRNLRAYNSYSERRLMFTEPYNSISPFTPGVMHLPDHLDPPFMAPPAAPEFPAPPHTHPRDPSIRAIGYHTQPNFGQISHEDVYSRSERLPSATPPAQPEFNAVNLHTPWNLSHQKPSTTIHNGTFIGGNVNHNGESGINILHRIAAAEAFHDPADSYDQPRCHPETRTEMLEKLENWCINSEWPTTVMEPPTTTDMEPIILWLHGPAGAGKSAIMASLSQRLADAKRLGGTFFFKRGHPRRGNAQVLFDTLALQLAVNVPQLKSRISRAVDENPTIVGRSINVQLRELILEPSRDLDTAPWTIIIDGLDECAGEETQQEILHLIRDSAKQRRPLKFIIASRPEAHIREVVEGPSFRGVYRGFNVEQSFNDVRTYFRSEFAKIHRDHSTMGSVQIPWPSEEIMEHLVDKSSGYFIYATTVIKFVGDKHFRPTARLKIITDGTEDSFQSPFGALDQLYTQILSAVPPPHDRLVAILRVVLHFGMTPSQIEVVLGMAPGDVELSLRGLHSVLQRNKWEELENSAGLQNLARSILTELSYMYEDTTKNRTHLIGWTPWLVKELGHLLNQVEPSHELVRLFRAMNPDFIINIFELGYDSPLPLQWFPSPVTDLVQIWQDYDQLAEQVTECPLLLRILASIVLLGHSNLLAMRHVLNLSWDEQASEHQRRMWQAILRIDVAFKKRALNETILASHKHIDGGVHSHIPLLEAPKEQGMLESYIHLFGDTVPTSAAGYASDLLTFMEKLH